MKCQNCDKAATHHVTEIVAGKPVEYHVCDTHLHNLDALPPAAALPGPKSGFGAFWRDPKLNEALRDAVARDKIAAYLLPVLCQALLDDNPEVRVSAAFRLMLLGGDARSTVGALQDARHDQDE